MKNIFDLPLSLIQKSKEITIGSGDSGGPVLDQDGNLIGVMIESTIEDTYREKNVLSIFSDTKRRMHYNGTRYASFGLCAASLAYLASTFADTSLLLSSCIGVASTASLSVIADKLLNTSPSEFIYNHFYVDPFLNLVKTCNTVMKNKIKQDGCADNMSVAITDDIKSWVDGVIERAKN
jgi:hypothetical protein